MVPFVTIFCNLRKLFGRNIFGEKSIYIRYIYKKDSTINKIRN